MSRYKPYSHTLRGYETFHYRLLKTKDYWYTLEDRIEVKEGDSPEGMLENLRSIRAEISELITWLEDEIKEVTED